MAAPRSAELSLPTRFWPFKLCCGEGSLSGEELMRIFSHLTNPHRIHVHVAITVLSLLLERTVEHACQDTWRNIRDDLKQVQLALLSSPNDRFWQVTEPSPDAANRLKNLKIKPPKPILNLD